MTSSSPHHRRTARPLPDHQPGPGRESPCSSRQPLARRLPARLPFRAAPSPTTQDLWCAKSPARTAPGPGPRPFGAPRPPRRHSQKPPWPRRPPAGRARSKTSPPRTGHPRCATTEGPTTRNRSSPRGNRSEPQPPRRPARGNQRPRPASRRIENPTHRQTMSRLRPPARPSRPQPTPTPPQPASCQPAGPRESRLPTPHPDRSRQPSTSASEPLVASTLSDQRPPLSTTQPLPTTTPRTQRQPSPLQRPPRIPPVESPYLFDDTTPVPGSDRRRNAEQRTTNTNFASTRRGTPDRPRASALPATETRVSVHRVLDQPLHRCVSEDRSAHPVPPAGDRVGRSVRQARALDDSEWCILPR